jgi:hypothetical protein
MDKIDLAFSRVKIEMEKLIKENEFLKTKMSNMYTFEETKKIHLYQRKVRQPFMIDAALKEMFDEETQRLIIDKN